MKNTSANARPGIRTRIVTILAGAAAIAYALLVFVPSQQSIAGLRSQIQEKELRISQNERLTEPMRQIEQQLQATNEFTADWRRQAPRSNSVAAVYAEVIRHAKTTRAEVLSMTPQAEQSLDTVGLTPVALQAAGTYRSIHQFIEKLESMPAELWVDDLQMTPARDGKDLSCTLKLIIFADRGEISG